MVNLVPVFGALVLAFMWRREVVFFRADKVLLCLFVQVLVSAVTGYAAKGAMSPDPLEGVKIMAGLPLWRGFAAGLEDALFVLPAFLLPPNYRGGFLILSMASFALGHAYQGNAAMLAKLPAVPVVYFLAARYGILTTIAAHSITDVLALIAIRVLWRGLAS